MNKDTLPPLPENLLYVLRRIRACESEAPTQVVLEHFVHQAIAAHERVQGVPGWVPITKALLASQEPWLYEPCWLATKNGTHIDQGVYEWRQGQNPDRFRTPEGDDIWAFDVDYVMPARKPLPPTASPPPGEPDAEFMRQVAFQDGYHTAMGEVLAKREAVSPGEPAPEPQVEPKVLPLRSGYKRQWVKCRTCSQVAHYDYVPYSLSSPIMTMPCGHGIGEKDMGADRISEEQALAAPEPQGVPEPAEEGPLLDGEGWTITFSNGHSGSGWYAHCEDYPEEGAVFVAAAHPHPPAEPAPSVQPAMETPHMNVSRAEFEYMRNPHAQAVQSNDDGAVLPCPFCGSHDISDGEMLTEESDGTTYTQSECKGCGAIGPKGFLNRDVADYGCVKAIAAWNRRAAQPAPTGAQPAPTQAAVERTKTFDSVEDLMAELEKPYEFTPELLNVIRFLLGEASLDGYWFSERPTNAGAFWWRTNLRAALSPSQPQQERKPLNDDEIEDGAIFVLEVGSHLYAFEAGVRFAERQHGITSAPKAPSTPTGGVTP